jgi:multiple sugar transport system ATP-binding protein
MAGITIRGAIKRFPEFTLGPIDVDIRSGEFFGVFGPPSSGKTSILKLILGLLRPDEGQVEFDSVDAANLDVDNRNISMVFQNLALFPHMTGRENIIFPLTERNRPEAEISERLDFVAKVLHVSHILHKNPAQMSGGERQRIALGRAFAAHSQAMLLDEPIAALDARLREEMRVELKRLQRENNQTFVYVSHDEEEVLAISDRVAVVIEGKIAQLGTPADVYDMPHCLSVAKVIGSPPMNFFAGTCTADGQGFEADALMGPLRLGQTITARQPLTIGVRPEDIWINRSGTVTNAQATVTTCEPLGSYTIVNAKLADQFLKIRVQGQVGYAFNEVIDLCFDERRLHVFGADGQRK